MNAIILMSGVIFGSMFFAMLPNTASAGTVGHDVASSAEICAISVQRDVKALGEGRGPGTKFENTVILAALKGNIPELDHEFAQARRDHPPKYLTRWLDIALGYSVRAGKKAAVDLLLHLGAAINRRDDYMKIFPVTQIRDTRAPYLGIGGNPLANAVQCGRPAMTDFLLQRGADMYASHTGFHPEFPGNAVYAAIVTGSAKLVSVFLKHGLDPCKVRRGPYLLPRAAREAGLSPVMQSRLECTSP